MTLPRQEDQMKPTILTPAQLDALCFHACHGQYAALGATPPANLAESTAALVAAGYVRPMRDGHEPTPAGDRLLRGPVVVVTRDAGVMGVSAATTKLEERPMRLVGWYCYEDAHGNRMDAYPHSDGNLWHGAPGYRELEAWSARANSVASVTAPHAA